MINLIFLDIDGVLNSEQYVHKLGEAWTGDELDSECINRLNKVTDMTEAKIVISSSWRICYSLGKLRRILKDNGVHASIIGVTPVLSTGNRSDEINDWLYDNKDIVNNYVIFDDDSLEAAKDSSDPVLDQHFVRTSWLDGLQDRHVKRAIDILQLI